MLDPLAVLDGLLEVADPEIEVVPEVDPEVIVLAVRPLEELEKLESDEVDADATLDERVGEVDPEALEDTDADVKVDNEALELVEPGLLELD